MINITWLLILFLVYFNIFILIEIINLFSIRLLSNRCLNQIRKFWYNFANLICHGHCVWDANTIYFDESNSRVAYVNKYSDYSHFMWIKSGGLWVSPTPFVATQEYSPTCASASTRRVNELEASRTPALTSCSNGWFYDKNARIWAVNHRIICLFFFLLLLFLLTSWYQVTRVGGGLLCTSQINMRSSPSLKVSKT